MRVNSDFNELRSRVRQRVLDHIREQEARRVEGYSLPALRGPTVLGKVGVDSCKQVKTASRWQPKLGDKMTPQDRAIAKRIRKGLKQLADKAAGGWRAKDEAFTPKQIYKYLVKSTLEALNA